MAKNAKYAGAIDADYSFLMAYYDNYIDTLAFSYQTSNHDQGRSYHQLATLQDSPYDDFVYKRK
jgi:hypothetical protein